MNDTDLLNAIKKIIDDNTVNSLKKFVIIKENNGYRVFEKYLILKKKNGFAVKKIYNDVEYTFSSLKYALTWCTLDNKNMILDSNRVVFLDNLLAGMSLNRALLEKYLNRDPKTDKTFIYANKIREIKRKQAQLTHELNGYSYKAKNYQLNWMTKIPSKL